MKIYTDSMVTALATVPNAGDARAHIASSTKAELRSIRTVGKDEKIGKVSCQATLSISVPAEIAKAIGTPGNLLGMAVQSLSLSIDGDRLEKNVEYTSQMTDDRKEVSVAARGAPEMGQLIAMLAASGMLKPSTPEPAVANASAPAPTSAQPETMAIAAPPAAMDTPERVANTRFGKVQIDSQQRVHLNGTSLDPSPEAGDHLEIVRTFQVGDSDAVLLQAINGTGCPSTFYMATVSAAGMSSTPSFGTCSDQPKVAQEGDGVRITMSGFVGNSEPKAEQDAAAREVHVFVYRNGTVAEEGGTRRPAAEAATKPSFSCSGNLSVAERMICDAPSLASADAQLGRLYATSLSTARDPAKLKQAQRQWREARDRCTDAACMEASYAGRLADLSR